MIEYISLFSRGQALEHLKLFNPDQETWIVSDLRTKIEIQKHLLEKNSYFKDTTVLRISDFWKLLFKRIAPEYRLVSGDYLQILVREFLLSKKEELGQLSMSEATVIQYMNQLAPIILHPHGAELIDSWFQKNPGSANRWKEWYLLARLVFGYLENGKIMSQNFIPAFLQNYPGEISNFWKQSLVVDLSSELSRVEADLLNRIAKSTQLKVLSPEPPWKDEFDFLLRPYQVLKDQRSNKVSVAEDMGVPLKSVQALRFSGQLAETKACVAQARKWLDQGILPHQIAIIAADIESYWPVLHPYFQQEGVPVQKDINIKMGSLPVVMRWMADLRIRTKELSSADLESSNYTNTSSPRYAYEEFCALFAKVYGYEDLDRDFKLKEFYEDTPKIPSKPLRDDFLMFAVKYWRGEEIAPLEAVIREVLANAKKESAFSLKDWVSYVEIILSKKEIVVRKGVEGGLVVSPLMAAHTSSVTHRIFLGVAEEFLQTHRRASIPPQDVEGIFQELGFQLDHPDQHFLEFETKWLSSFPTQEDHYFVGMSDFKGQPLNPSAFWLELHRGTAGTGNTHMGSVPGTTRWDSIQQSLLEPLSSQQGPVVTSASPLKLSASSLESYLDCAFSFYAGSLVGLRNTEEVDLEVGPRSDGSFAHAIFSELTKNHPLPVEMSEADIDELLKGLREKEGLQFGDERIWKIQQRKYKRLVQDFLAFENTWRKDFPRTQTILAEGTFSMNVEIAGHPVLFTGKVDRVDSDGDGKLMILDYKRGSAGLTNHGSWLGNSQIQLLFYLWAFEKNFFPGIKGKPVGAFYYVFKNFTRNKGLILNGEETLQPLPSRKGGPLIEQAAFAEMISSFEELVESLVVKIKAGEFAPNPKDKINSCEQCDFTTICRAPHLD